MKCEDCFYQMFKQAEPLNFKDELNELRIKLDVSFIKHFGQKSVKVVGKDKIGFGCLNGNSMLALQQRQGMAAMKNQQGLGLLSLQNLTPLKNTIGNAICGIGGVF